jgi:hypothetical protein
MTTYYHPNYTALLREALEKIDGLRLQFAQWLAFIADNETTAALGPEYEGEAEPEFEDDEAEDD